MKRQLFVIALILVAICPADEAARSDAETQSPEAPSSAAPLREQKSPIPWKTPTYTLVNTWADDVSFSVSSPEPTTWTCPFSERTS